MKKEEIIKNRIYQQRKALSNPMNRNNICNCDIENALYSDFGIIKCQYCGGVISNIERIKKYIEYNIPND